MSYFAVDVRTGEAKTQLIRGWAIRGAEESPLVRATAIALVRGLGRSEHVERIHRLHAFVRDSIDYVGEPIEMVHDAAHTLSLGAGDCDDHVVLLLALAWSLKYPISVQPIGPPSNPYHYSAAVGYPQALTPEGDASTTWVQTETTAPALTGEPIDAALARVGDYR